MSLDEFFSGRFCLPLTVEVVIAAWRAVGALLTHEAKVFLLVALLPMRQADHPGYYRLVQQPATDEVVAGCRFTLGELSSFPRPEGTGYYPLVGQLPVMSNRSGTVLLLRSSVLQPCPCQA